MLCLTALGLLLSSAGAQAQTSYNGTRQSGFSYYQVSDGAKSGLLKSETIEPNNPQLCVVTNYGYDAYGNKTSASTANCAGASGSAVFTTRGSSSSYPTAATTQTITVGGSSASVSIVAGMFAQTSTNALNQSESRTYDPRFGAVLSLTGPNGLTTSWTLDDFGRKTRELRADNTSTVNAYCVLSSSGLSTGANSSTASGDPMDCPSSPTGEAPSDAVMFVHSEPRDAANAKMGPYVRVYTDRLGRELRSVTESFDGSAQASGRSDVPVYKDTVYNPQGVKILVTQAYFAVSGSTTTTGSIDVGVTRIVVDALGRPTTIYTADPKGAGGSQVFGGSGTFGYGIYGSRTASVTSYTYSGLDVTTKNDKNQTRTEEKNAIGELVRVTDAAGAQIAYQRDAFGNLLTTRDPLGNRVDLIYDIRGRKTQLTDPDTGIWTYAYDALGQLVAQQGPTQRAAGTQTSMAYDQLGRMTGRTEPEYTSNWYYDKNADGSFCMDGTVATRGAGKLCESNTSNGVNRKVAYDNLGRPVSSRTTISAGPSFASALIYNANGRIATQTYPTGVQVGYTYTGLGFLEKLLLNTAATIAPLPNSQGLTAAGATLTAGPTVLWQAQVVNASGRAEQQSYGYGVNAITSRAVFDGATGRISDLTAGMGAGSSVLAQHYTWDSLGNLTGRTDDNGDGNSNPPQAVTEAFVYGDTLNRLTSYTVTAPLIPGLSRTVNLQYNALGMLLYKSDVGNYSYPAQGGATPHALQSVAGYVNTSFTYDANGNLSTASAGKYRSLSYTSFNLPDSGTGIQGPAGSPKYTWQYDENHARIRETHVDASGTRTTWYLHPDNQGGLGFESETAPSGAVSNRHYLSVGGQAIGVMVSTTALQTLPAGQLTPPAIASINLVKLEFWHKDHLGSLITTTDHTGAVTQRYAYDPFGKRRESKGTYDEFGNVVVDWSPSLNWGTDRGFTGHEHLDDIGLVHMNGRIFDPTLGVFLQGDPLIQDPSNLQNYNRFGYCYNNPMGCTDPSGFCFLGCFWQPMAALNMLVRLDYELSGLRFLGIDYRTFRVGESIAFAVAANIVTGGAASVFDAAIIGFMSGAIATGNTKGALQGAFTAGMFYGAGNVIQGGNFFTGGGTAGSYSGFGGKLGAVALHGVVGCVTSMAGGGKCGQGALSAAFSETATVRGWQFEGYAGVISSAIIGGTASVLGGGKFANGAQTAAMGYLFNFLSHARFDRATGVLSVQDVQVGRNGGIAEGVEVQGNFFSGTGPDDQIAPGRYAILQRGTKDGFRLEALDSTFGDDTNDSGQSLLRLHGPGRSNGCITACDASNWGPVRELIQNTKPIDVVVPTYRSITVPGGYLIYRWQTGTETIKWYGVITVK